MRDVEAQLIHDMQNTAVVLREAASQLQEHRDTMAPAMAAHLHEMLVRRSDMLVRLLGDLSTSHLAGRGQLSLALQRVSLAEICQEVLAERHTSDGVQISIQVPADAVVVADPVRVTQVVDNLVTNALRYGGPQVSVGAVRDGGSVRLTVKDNGPGVPDELVGELFQAYVRGSTSSGLGGSGLGLLIVRQLCEAMGGTIAYAGDQDGARFTATLPALPLSLTNLGADVADAGHSVAFWADDADLAQSLVTYVLTGLTKGEAVVVAATPAHHDLLETLLTTAGIDTDAAIASGQLVPLDADALHRDLARAHHIDHRRFETLIASPVRDIAGRWRRVRVFGEIVDLYWRAHDQHLALELEGCWNNLRSEVDFPLLCGYELAPGESSGPICDCHDAVVAG